MIAAMISAGLRALRGRWKLALALYAVELGVALVFTWAVAHSLGQAFGHRPLFDRGVAGDGVALSIALEKQTGLITALSATGVALAVGYGVLSWYLGAGLLGALAGERFGDAAGERFFAFVRVWLWSIIPYVISLVVITIGLVVTHRSLERTLTWFDLVGRPLVGALPGLALLAITACASDYARAILTVDRNRRATRATLRAWRLVFTRPIVLVHYLVYLLLWVAITLIYARGTLGSSFAGVGGALALLLLRQLVAGARFAARFAVTGGQLEATGRCARSA